MKFAFYTLGCKVNQYETSVMQKAVTDSGNSVVAINDSPDVIVVNSCTVTSESDRKARQNIRKYRRANPQAVIVLTGCLPQAFPDDAAGLDAADILLGNGTNSMLIKSVEQFLATGERIINIAKHERDAAFDTPPIDKFPERTRAYLKIQDGCERYCTYCIIPMARGFVRSKSPDDIVKEVTCLAHAGHKEIVLVGINLSTYGKDSGLNLCDAVDAVCSVDGIDRVRLGSLEPDLFTDEMLERLAAEPKFCPQFHLALQSGCDATLKRMNRHYTSEFYADLVNRIRAKFSNSSITTDIMVGFAGETEEEFNESLAFVKSIGFARSHVFAYSRRSGTIADRLPNQVTSAVKQARSAKMIAATTESEQIFLATQVGLTVPVLFETYENGVNCGYSENYTHVKAVGKDLRGEIANVKITAVEGDGCVGEINENQY